MALCAYPKGVHVRAYQRYRFKRWEEVRSHCRSYPRQLTLFS